MPINSFEHYPMTWTPNKDTLASPYYVSLAAQLENDIVCGNIAENTMLPPQRELADYLDLSLNTITRAYKLCEVKGLIFGKVGKGTFVTLGKATKSIISENENGLIEMGMTLPSNEFNKEIAAISCEILGKNTAHSIFEYSNPFGTENQKQAAQKWLSIFGVTANTQNIGFASGAQNALAIVLTVLFKAGDKIATDAFTYPNFIGLANLLQIELIAVKGDADGMLDEALEKACRLNKIKGIYLMPAQANPTNVVMSHKRKAQIAKLIDKYELILIEDDIFGFLSNDKNPMVNLVPENTIYINSLSKSLCGGLRVAYFTFPQRFRTIMANGMFNINIKVPSINIEIATEIINRKFYEKVVEHQIKIVKERNLIFSEYFSSITFPQSSNSYIQWLSLPQNCTGKSFELMCKDKGVIVYGSERFCVGEALGQNAVRISVSSPKDTFQLRKGLEVVKEIYEGLRANEIHSFIL